MAFPVVLVTGASRGIGLAVTQILLAKHKANVITLSRTRTPELESLHQKYPSTLQIIQCDVTDEAATSAAISAAHAHFGRLNALVLNAGGATLGRVSSSETSVDVWKQLFDLNFFSLLHTVRAALTHLRSSNGRIVFVSSGAATGGTVGWGAYNTSKAAMNSFCRTLANEEPNLTCVALHPGLVDTDMQVRMRSEGAAHMVASDHARFLRAHATGKMVKPSECGGVIAALAIKATKDLSGKFLLWNDEELSQYKNIQEMFPMSNL